MAAVLTGLNLMQACGQPESTRATAPTQNRTDDTVVQQKNAKPMRLIVKFGRAGAFRDAATLADLTRQSQAQLSYISSISDDTHVYQALPFAGRSADEVLARLRAVPSVVYVEFDRTATPY